MTGHPRLDGADRDRVAADYARRYQDGASIADIAADTNRSYSGVYKLLRHARTPLRGRGQYDRTRANRTTSQKGTTT